MDPEVICEDCGWEGLVSETFENDPDNDSCPVCGNETLTYIVED